MWNSTMQITLSELTLRTMLHDAAEIGATAALQKAGQSLI